MGTLSVRENLMFSANLRLPEVILQAEREDRVENAIRELGLSRCADTKVCTCALIWVEPKRIQALILN